MTKKKVPAKVVHRIYTGNHVQSSRSVAFGKCTCGAVLEGQEAIDEHRLLMDGPRDGKPVGNVPHGPSENHPTARAG